MTEFEYNKHTLCTCFDIKDLRKAASGEKVSEALQEFDEECIRAAIDDYYDPQYLELRERALRDAFPVQKELKIRIGFFDKNKIASAKEIQEAIMKPLYEKDIYVIGDIESFELSGSN